MTEFDPYALTRALGGDEFAESVKRNHDEFMAWSERLASESVKANGQDGTPRTFIQWKGTNICVDFECPCGRSAHMDTYFLYAVVCPDCGRRWELDPTLLVREVHEGEECQLDPIELEDVHDAEAMTPGNAFDQGFAQGMTRVADQLADGLPDGPDGLSVFEREPAGPTITVEFNATGSMNAGIRALDERGDTMSEDMPTFWWHESHGLLDGRGWELGPSDPKMLAIHPKAMKLTSVSVDPATMSLVEVPTRRLLQELQLRFRAQEDELQARREGREPEEWIHGDVPGL